MNFQKPKLSPLNKSVTLTQKTCIQISIYYVVCTTTFIKKTTPQKGSHWSSTSMNEDICWLHSSEISGLGLMKCSLRNTSKFAPYLWNKKNPKYSFFSSFYAWKKKLLWSFLLPKILGKLWSVWFKHFIKRKPFISEECTYVRNKNELVWLLLSRLCQDIFSYGYKIYALMW